VELKNGAEVAGTVAWARNGSLGIAFDRPIDLGATLADRHGRKAGGRARMPRIELRCATRIEAGATSFGATILDISQQGAKLALDRPVERGPVRLEIPGLGRLSAAIRWRSGDHAGLAFDQAISFAELAAWLADRNGPATMPPLEAKRA
jgi:hypothetical protein